MRTDVTGIVELGESQGSPFPVGALLGLIQALAETQTNEFAQAFLLRRRVRLWHRVGKDLALRLDDLQWDQTGMNVRWVNGSSWIYIIVNERHIEQGLAGEQRLFEHGIR